MKLFLFMASVTRLPTLCAWYDKHRRESTLTGTRASVLSTTSMKQPPSYGWRECRWRELWPSYAKLGTRPFLLTRRLSKVFLRWPLRLHLEVCDGGHVRQSSAERPPHLAKKAWSHPLNAACYPRCGSMDAGHSRLRASSRPFVGRRRVLVMLLQQHPIACHDGLRVTKSVCVRAKVFVMAAAPSHRKTSSQSLVRNSAESLRGIHYLVGQIACLL